MARPRPTNVNYSELFAKISKRDNKDFENVLDKMSGETLKAFKASLERASAPAGEANLKEGDILYLPLPTEIADSIRNSAFANNDPRTKEERPYVGVRSLIVAEEKGGHRFLNMSAFLAEVTDTEGNTQRGECPDDIRKEILGCVTKDEQFMKLCTFMEGKALQVKKKRVIESDRMDENTKPIKRSIYDFAILDS